MEPKRFFPAVAVGGGLAGVIVAIPVLGDLLRGLFCIGVMAGAAASMKLWLDTHRAENLALAETATLGALSGVVTAGVSWILSLPLRLAFGDGLSQFYESFTVLPDLVRHNLQALYTPSAPMIVMSLPLQVAIYGVMGAVGAVLAREYAFSSRKADG